MVSLTEHLMLCCRSSSGCNTNARTLSFGAILQGADLANAFMGGRADFKNGTLADKRLEPKELLMQYENLGKHLLFHSLAPRSW